MIESAESLRDLLAGSAWQGRAVIELPILDTGESALALQIERDEVEDAWQTARALVPQTGRWPIATVCWSHARSGWVEQMQDADFFSRFGFIAPPNAENTDPQTILTAANDADITAFLREKKAAAEDWFDELDAMIQSELAITAGIYGGSPSLEEVYQALGQNTPAITPDQVDRWLLDWEQKQEDPHEDWQRHLEWYSPQPQDPIALLFLPITCSWDALAYLSWFPTEYQGTENYSALGRSWQERYGAELVAHYGTMLQCYVSRPPNTIQAAWDLAQEQILIAPCTTLLSGIPLRHHALALLHFDRWFLHERP
ncbi:MAG: DUF4253 domain-containing protein [Synechococcaceae cyanobacterium SM2_3_2]|nr:DUF4253 domain-containing protein [Synechococcaceae cyanobacterium SM2_3_2]